jgi:hypothetical protein
MNRSSLQVTFRFPDEFDLVLPYLAKQKEVLAKQDQPMLPYRILQGETETIVEFEMTAKDWENPLGLNSPD